ncbi:MBL fold metallo-hydrolase [Pseudonocardia endophytica]|uniref:Cyclase n=1 Tax=Pseudonocardia endophytica TaxID=401976 RepID=A0A4R1HIX7_PSEEN|nr:MBL fold metallo-hydrolase [Pseudonocardia endophytica]TCK22217.1 cyclase [Pseudonocardia endophytica]
MSSVTDTATAGTTTGATARRPFGPETGTLQDVADGVLAYVQPDGGWCLNNAGVVLDPSGAGPVLIDTAATQARARRLRAEVERVAGAPPAVVANTHFHGDHHFGNAEFLPGATIVGHDRTREEILAAGLDMTGLWPDVEWGEITLAPPTVTFSERMTLLAPRSSEPGRPVELIHVGAAHTANDVVAWLPEQRVLFAGDVVLSGCTPFCLMGSVTRSIATLRRLRRLDPHTIVPGHGPVGGPELLDEAEAYLRWVIRLALHAMADGVPPLEAARRADLGPFAALRDSERLVANLHRALVDLDGAEPGALIDIREPYTEMVAFHGGPPVCHA